MSDDRFTREPGDDTDEPHADRTHVDPKPRSWYNRAPATPFDLAAECDKFLDRFCAELGIKRGPKAKEKRARAPEEPAKAPSEDDWKRVAPERREGFGR